MKPNLLCVDAVAWEPDPRYDAMQTTVLETKSTNLHYKLLLVRFDGNGVISKHIYAIETENRVWHSGARVCTGALR